jgi:hypothetical protein
MAMTAEKEVEGAIRRILHGSSSFQLATSKEEMSYELYCSVNQEVKVMEVK